MPNALLLDRPTNIDPADYQPETPVTTDADRPVDYDDDDRFGPSDSVQDRDVADLIAAGYPIEL